MPRFASYDGTEIGYHVRGDGPPLVCLFNDATVTVQPAAGHYPWVGDPAAFAAAISSFLG
jgi:hypothetical protein